MTKETERKNYRTFVEKIISYGYTVKTYEGWHEGVKIYRNDKLIGYVYISHDWYPVPCVRPNISRFCEESHAITRKRKALEEHYLKSMINSH